MVDSAQCDECRRIEENSTYSAETHHILAKRQRLVYVALQLIPAVATALLGTLAVGEVVPPWVGVVALITAIFTAIGTVLNPQRGYYEHKSAAKAFTAIKHDARFVLGSGERLETNCLAVSIKCLHDRYNGLVQAAPVTQDWAFERARKRIHSGVHAPDGNA